MINRVTKLNNIGIFPDTQWMADDMEFKKINLLYGFNGSGKTTFSNVARLLSDDFSKEEKNEVIEKLKNDDNKDIDFEMFWDEQKIKTLDDKKNILVFNSNFVSDHISDEKIKKFKGGIVIKEHLENPKIKKIEEEIQNATAEKSQISKEVEKLSDLSKIIYKDLSTKWNKSITGFRLPTGLNLENENTVPTESSKKTIDEIEEKLENHFHKFKISKNKQGLHDDIKFLESIEFMSLIGSDLSKQITPLLQSEITQDSYKKIEEKIKKYKDINLKNSSTQDWFENGLSLLNKSGEKCPLCDSTIDVKKIITEYSEFFNKRFSELQDSLNQVEETVKRIMAMFMVQGDNVEKLKNLLYKYNVIEQLSDQKKEVINNFSDKELIISFNYCKNLIERKKTEINFLPSREEIKKISELHSIIRKYNDHFSAIASIRISLLKGLKENNFNDKEARNSARELFWKKFDNEGKGNANKFFNRKQLNEDTANNDKKNESGIHFYHWLTNKNGQLDKKIRENIQTKNIMLAQLKKESEFVNLFLKHLSASNFKIKISDKDDEKIEVVYINGIIKKGVNYTLSDGEKTALAFAYFLSKIKYEIQENTQNDLKDYVVLIDDPVSSLDENRLFSTALVIKNIFGKDDLNSTKENYAQHTKQLFVLSHNLIFLKFLGNILVNTENKNREDFYLENGKILLLPKALQNYQTSYFYKIQKILDYLDDNNELNYEKAKDFLPNNIRVVLETFLSFKLCKLKQGSGSDDRFKTIGLNKLIPCINSLNCAGFNEVGDIKDKETLVNALWAVKNKVDSESHGSAQDITDFEFLSENELNSIAKQSLDIIEYLDQIHISNIKSL